MYFSASRGLSLSLYIYSSRFPHILQTCTLYTHITHIHIFHRYIYTHMHSHSPRNPSRCGFCWGLVNTNLLSTAYFIHEPLLHCHTATRVYVLYAIFIINLRYVGTPHLKPPWWWQHLHSWTGARKGTNDIENWRKL